MKPGTRRRLSRPQLERKVAALEAELARLRRACGPIGRAAEAGAAGQAVRQLFGVIEKSPQAVVVHRGEGPLYANPALAELLDLPSREHYMAGTSVLEHVHPDDRAAVAAHVRRFLADEPVPAIGEFRLIRPDGTTVWVVGATTRVIWDGAPAVASSMTDISARKRAERALRRSQELFLSVFHACPDAMSLSELATGRVIDVNDAWLRLSLRQRAEIVGQTSADLGIFAEDGFRDRLLEAVRRDGKISNLETTLRLTGGEPRDFAISAEVLRLGDQELLLAVSRDITERRRQEQELRRSREAAERANRSKSEFLASMSHELRTPLNAIIGFSEVLRDELFGPLGTERYAEYATDIHRSGEHLLHIINDLLDLSKLEAGKLELFEAVVAPAEVIEDCLRLVRARAENGGVRLAMALPAALPELFADPRLLKQIMLNLLSNAVKFTPEGGTVTAGARRRDDGGVDLYVVDTGIGMSADDVTVALTPFGQVDGGLERRHEGTGLGLPLAQQLARLHDGDLTVDSAPEAGTTVTVAMPPGRTIGETGEPLAAAG